VLLRNSEQWFALYVKPRTERQVAAILRTKGYEEFLPTREVRTGGVSSHQPLFPGYMFCRVSHNVHGLIVTTPGVIRIVGFGGKPVPIDPEEISSLQIVVRSKVPTSTWEGLHPGDKVFINDGPLTGAVGVLTSIRAKQRLIITITMMMRTVAAEVEPDWVSAFNPVSERKPFSSYQQLKDSA